MASAQVPASLFPPAIPSLDNTFGAIVIGTYIGLILYGVNLHQAYRYARLYPNDSKWLKSLVAVVMVLETFTSVLGMHACYYHLVTNYFQPEKLEHPAWLVFAISQSLDVHPVASGLTVVITQSFFFRRVWIIAPRFRPLVIVSVLCALASLGLVSTATAKGFLEEQLQEEVDLERLCAISSALDLVADIFITSVLIHALHRSRTGLKRTDSMIDLMIMYTVSTGLVTGIVYILVTILVFALPGQLLYVSAGIVGTKLYANTLLAALNSRQHVASYGGTDVDLADVSAFGFAPPPAGSGSETYTSQLQRARRTTNDADGPTVVRLNVSAETASIRSAPRGVEAEKEAV